MHACTLFWLATQDHVALDRLSGLYCKIWTGLEGSYLASGRATIMCHVLLCITLNLLGSRFVPQYSTSHHAGNDSSTYVGDIIVIQHFDCEFPHFEETFLVNNPYDNVMGSCHFVIQRPVDNQLCLAR